MHRESQILQPSTPNTLRTVSVFKESAKGGLQKLNALQILEIEQNPAMQFSKFNT